MTIANQVQASPGLYVNAPGQPLPGIPPNMSVMAAISAGLLPANVLQTGLGVRDSRPGRSVLESVSAGSATGVGLSAANPYGWPNGGAAGGNGLGAGGLNQTDGPSAGDVAIVNHAAPGTMSPVNGGLQPAAAISSPNLTIPAQPVYQG